MKKTALLACTVIFLVGCASVQTLSLGQMSTLSVADPLLGGHQWRYKGSDSEFHHFRHYTRKGIRGYPLDFRIIRAELTVPQERELTDEQLEWTEVTPLFNEAEIVTGIEQPDADVQSEGAPSD